MEKENFRKLMYLSWTIQHERRLNRSRSLSYAWGLYHAQDIAARLIVKQHAAGSSSRSANLNALKLFKR